MPSVPGYCARCDLVFPGHGGIHIQNSQNITLRGNTLNCPTCGRPAKLMEGTFNATDDDFELIAGPPLTEDILRRFRDIAERARKREITPKQAIVEANEISPVLGSLLGRYLALGLTAVGVLVTLIAAYISFVALGYQKESLELQKVDSKISGDFYADALKELKKQTMLLEQIAQIPAPPNSAARMEQKRDRLTAETAAKKPVAIEKPSTRRAEVNKKKREDLKRRRMMFNPRKHPPNS